jgi:hypothetical protein
VDISEPILPPGTHCTGACASAPPADATFQGASQDGSKVFFLTVQPLRNSDTDTKTDLYEAELEGEGKVAHIGKLVQVSHDPNAGQAAEVQGVVRVSEDGSHVYFVAKGVLTLDRNGLGQEAEAGEDNLYVYNTATQQTAFVAILSEADAGDWAESGGQEVQATPNGRFLAFSSHADLTPDDTSTATQLFRYDAETGDLIRVSVGQNGFNSNGNTSAFGAKLPRFGISGAARSGLAISDDGSYVVFQSADGLTPQALNGQMGEVVYEEEGEIRTASYFANNVYEYHDGNVSLVSDGNDATAKLLGSSVELIGTTPSGGDVFFQGADRLVRQDTDTQLDVYDARIGGGFSAPTFAPCLGEACQGAVGAPPLVPSIGSSTLSGGGNLSPKPEVKPVLKPKPKARPLTRVQKLANALKACGRQPKKRQASCRTRARKRYGAKLQTKKLIRRSK